MWGNYNVQKEKDKNKNMKKKNQLRKSMAQKIQLGQLSICFSRNTFWTISVDYILYISRYKFASVNKELQIT